MGRYEHRGKRALDLTVAGVALILVLPILALAATAIWLEDRGPVLFVQDRVGAGGASFGCLKLRSMPVHARRDLASADAQELEVTRVGRWLRRLSVDETPQVLNVLRGDMSVVGPRPGLSTQTVLHDARRASGAIRLRPGLTGLAQLHGYDGMTEEAKAVFDGRYAERVSLRGDLSIILRTVPLLLRKPPIY